jgi:lysyl-tRNA synthetase class 1
MSAEVVELDTPSWVAAVLDQFEAARFFDEGDVAGHIFAAATKVESPTPEEKKAANVECWAFRFHPQPHGEESEWKTHFGPAFVRGDFRNPDIAWLDQSVVKYWEKRMTAARHPLLRARYADLIWDLSKPACSLKAPIDAARIAIDGYVAAGALADADSAMTASDRLQRGLRLAVSVGDQPRAEQARDALVALFTRVNETWGWVTLFDMFEESPKIKLTDAQKDVTVTGFEAHVTEVAGKPEGIDPGGSLHVAARLVRNYQRAGRQQDADRVVMACGQAAERYAATADHTRAHFWLDQVFKFYRINGLDADAERVQLEARRRGELARGEAQAVPAEVDVPHDELEKFLTELTDGGLDAALQRIAGHFVPHLDTLRDRLQRFRKEFPMATMWPIAKMAEGQMVAQIGPVDTDPEGALINAVADEIRRGRFFLKKALDRLRERYSVTADQIVDFLFESVAFTVGIRGIVHEGVEAYLAGDHPKAISLLVPQIENGLRFLLPLLGRPPNKPKRGNQPGMTEKTLTDILEYEPVIKDKVGEDAHLYMVAFLADARGLNVRNRMCHGLMMQEDFNRWVSDRVLHTMLMLGMCRRKKEPAAPPPDAARPEASDHGKGRIIA